MSAWSATVSNFSPHVMALPYRRICLWLVSFFAVGALKANTGTVTGGSGFTATWTTSSSGIIITGTWNAAYPGDQLLLFRPSYPTGGIDGGQVSTAGQHTVSWSYGISGSSGSFQVVRYSTNGGLVDTYTTNICSGSWTLDAVPDSTSNPVSENSSIYKQTNPFNKDLVITYTDSVTGEVLKTITLAPGETSIYQIIKTSSNAVNETYTLPDGGVAIVTMTDGTTQGGIYAPGASWSGPAIPNSDFAPTQPSWQSPTNRPVTPPPVSQVTSTTTNVSQTTNNTTMTDGTKSSIQFSGPGNGTGGATDNSVREGASAIVSKLDQLNKTLISLRAQGIGGGGGSGSSSDDGTHTRLDTANAKLDEIKTALSDTGTIGKISKAQSEALDKNPTEGQAESAGTAAGSDLSGSYPETSAPSDINLPKAEPDFTVALPASFGGKPVDLNPFRSDRLGPVADWFRTATAWLVVVSFGIWASTAVAEWTRGASQIRQAQGNPVVGGTGAQATALVAAAAITVAVSTFIVALVGWLAGDLGFSSIVNALGANPMSGAPGAVAWMLDRMFPVAMMVSALVARVSWNLYAAKIFAVAMSVIRFIVP